MLINGKKALASVQEIITVNPLYMGHYVITEDNERLFCPDLDDDGNRIYSDSLERVMVLGWSLVADKGVFQVCDKCVFIEIGSLVPSSSEEGGYYCVKARNIPELGICSQGTVVPLAAFGIDPETPIGTDLTDALGIVSSKQETAPETPVFEQKSGILNKIFHKKNNAFSCDFPAEVNKTSLEYVQNIPRVLGDKTPMIVTELLDGLSTTWLMIRRGKEKFDFCVCSHDFRIPKPTDGSTNIYWEVAKKYDAYKQLKDYLTEHPKLEWVCIQGEIYGEDVNGSHALVPGCNFAAFSFMDSKHGRFDSWESADLLDSWLTYIPWVPFVSMKYVLPDLVQDLQYFAEGPSLLNPELPRKGLVFRSVEAAFKVVSPEYLKYYSL